VGRRVVEMHVLVAREPQVAFGLVGGETVEDEVDFALRTGGDDWIHEVEEFGATTSLVGAADDFAASEVERGEQRRRAVALVIVRGR
jgi:hypothetical protein